MGDLSTISTFEDNGGSVVASGTDQYAPDEDARVQGIGLSQKGLERLEVTPRPDDERYDERDDERLVLVLSDDEEDEYGSNSSLISDISTLDAIDDPGALSNFEDNGGSVAAPGTGQQTSNEDPRLQRLELSRENLKRLGKVNTRPSDPTETSILTDHEERELGSGRFPCQHCGANIRDINSLRNHIKKFHERPYPCVFRFAGCTSTFAGKTGWKRHVATQHLRLRYWVCQEGACGQISNRSNAIQMSDRKRGNSVAALQPWTAPATFSGSSLPNGKFFAYKDVYRQHFRHTHTLLDKPMDSEARRRAEQQALRVRCTLPTHMRCPAQPHGCESEFVGEKAWDERMEHVAKHLESSAASGEPPLDFGDANDPTLMDWASHPDVALIRKNADDQWELNNPEIPTTKMTVGEAILALSIRGYALRKTRAALGPSVGTKEDDSGVGEALIPIERENQWMQAMIEELSKLPRAQK